MIDVWIVAVVADGPRGSTPEATLFLVGHADQAGAETAVLSQVGAPYLSVTAAPIPEGAAMALGMGDGEVRQLSR